jgi:hypothetical protein
VLLITSEVRWNTREFCRTALRSPKAASTTRSSLELESRKNHQEVIWMPAKKKATKKKAAKKGGKKKK